MVEAAFAIPFMLLCVVAIIYFGRAAYIEQILVYAAQEGARAAAAVPNLSDPSVRETVIGFEANGYRQTNAQTAVSNILGAANLLSNGKTGDLPASARVQVLPWDDSNDPVPPGTIAVKITYPFSLLTNPFTGNSGEVKQLNMSLGAKNDPGIRFGDLVFTEKATVAQALYQGG
jgi:Flp pilus assembly protein TadG